MVLILKSDEEIDPFVFSSSSVSKGTRICPDDAENPFVSPEASNPLFSNESWVEGVKHSGKAGRGMI